MSVRQQPATGDGDSGDERECPLSDAPLLDLLDALVKDRGRVAAAETLGVNYRTMMACYDSRHVSPRMRKALEEFRDAGAGAGTGTEAGGTEVDDDGAADEVETLRQRVAELEEEDRGLRGLVETQAGQLEELGRRVTQLVREAQQRGESEPVVGDDQPSVWRPPRRRHGLPDAGVVTLEEQSDEEHAFGPAAPLVTEWRKLRSGDEGLGSQVDRARAVMRRWELETELLRDFHLTLPPETEPLTQAGRADHLRWRLDALAEARAELAGARRVRLLRRILTLGLWWK